MTSNIEPMGYYDDRGMGISSGSGRMIKILSLTEDVDYPLIVYRKVGLDMAETERQTP